MPRSGKIVGIVSFFVIFGISVLITPLCAPCLTVFLGLAAGYFTGVSDKPDSKEEITKQGANSGLIAGGFAFAAQVLASIVNGLVVGPENANLFSETLGIAGTFDANSYYSSLVGLTICIGIINVGIMAGFGSLGGMAWWQFGGKDQTTVREELPPE
jgi:hypothetical protein